MLGEVTLPTEHEEQVLVMEWACHSGIEELGLLYAVPNGGFRHHSVGKMLKAEGVKKGVPDLVLPVARKGFHGLYIEMKRLKKSHTSKEQKWWLNKLSQQGYLSVICKGHDSAILTLTQYLTEDT